MSPKLERTKRACGALRLHGSSLRLGEQEFEIHEHEIVEYEKGGEGQELFEMARRPVRRQRAARGSLPIRFVDRNPRWG